MFSSPFLSLHRRPHLIPPKQDGEDNPYHCLHLPGHDHAVRTLAARGRTLVSGSYDCTVRIWDIITGEQKWVLVGHTQKGFSLSLSLPSHSDHPSPFFPVYSVVLDVNRKQTYSGSMDGTVRVWSLLNGTCLHTLTGHTSLVGLLGLSPSYLVSAAADSTLRIWDPSTGELKHTLAAHTGAITCFQHDEFKVLSGSDGNLKMWNIKDGTVVRDLLTGITGVWQVVFEGRWCVSASNRNDSTVLDVWDFGKECDGGDEGWIGEPASGVYDDESWSEYEEDEEGEGARDNGMESEDQGGDTGVRDNGGEELTAEAPMTVNLASLREKRNTMHDQRAGKGRSVPLATATTTVASSSSASASRDTDIRAQSEMMEEDPNMYEVEQEQDTNVNAMDLVPSDSELEMAGRIAAVQDRPCHPPPHAYHHHSQPQTPPSRHLRDKPHALTSMDGDEIDCHHDHARPGPSSSAPALGASMMRTSHTDHHPHLIRHALNIHPGDDGYTYERPQLHRQLGEQAEREGRDGDGDADIARDGDRDGGLPTRWVIEGHGSNGPTLTGVEKESGFRRDRLSSTRSIARCRRDKEKEKERDEEREFLLALLDPPIDHSGVGESEAGLGAEVQQQQQQQQCEDLPMLPVSQDTPTRHRITNRRRN